VGASALLRAIANDGSEPALVRASAMATMPVTNRAALETIASSARSADPLVRLGALQALTETPPDVRARFAAPLLSDALRAVRIDAASVLADVPLKGADERAAFERAAREYVDSQKFNADRAEARTNLGTFVARRGDVAAGERELRTAIELDRSFVPGYVNLADLYRANGRDADAEKVLREGLARLPKSAALHHALGLTLVRLKQYGKAQDELARAAALEPANARFGYVYAIALNSAGRRDQALAVLTKTTAAHPANIDVLQTLAAIYKERGDDATARRYAERARAVSEAELR
jgi:Flp pilus assembly protein TadD